MKNKKQKIFSLTILLILLCVIVTPFNFAEAKSGCCSWHGDVCGCKCCDDTSLSAKCAPYYPSCSSALTLKVNLSDSAYATIKRVIDGDTIEVELFDGSIEKVRLIGIDTPETVDPRKPVECFGKEATAEMKKLVSNKVVKLTREIEKNRDKYNRLLRYVYVTGSGTFVNSEMIKQGYAYAYLKYPFDSKLMKEFKQYEMEAQENKRGLWAGGVCENSKEKIPTFTVCALWFYSNWSECIDRKQTRTIIYSSPLNCVGGSPILSQSCQIETITQPEPETNESNSEEISTTNIFDGDIIQCQNSANPSAVYIVKNIGDIKYIRHIVSLEIFNHYKHLKWDNLKQVDFLDNYSLSGWVRYSTGANGTVGPNDKVYEINGDQTKHWINMTAEQFLAHGGSDAAIFNVNQGELNLYTAGADVMSL